MGTLNWHTHRVRSLLILTISLAGAVMLLSFPCERGHFFGDHFSGPHIRRSIERHTFLERSNTDTNQSDAGHEALVLPIEPQRLDSRLKLNVELTPQVPLRLMLSRLRLSPTVSGESEAPSSNS